MDKLDTKLLIHAGVELLVIGGVVYYLNGKIRTLSDKVAMLEQQNTQLKQMFDAHDQIIRDITGHQRPPPHNNGTKPNNHQTKPNQNNVSQKEPKVEVIDDNNLDDDLTNEYAELTNQ